MRPENSNPTVYATKDRAVERPVLDDSVEHGDASEIFDPIRDINDPEQLQTLEHLSLEELLMVERDDRETFVENDCPLLNLPVDVLVDSFSFLPARDVEKLRVLCRALKAVVDEKRSSLPKHRCRIEISRGVNSYMIDDGFVFKLLMFHDDILLPMREQWREFEKLRLSCDVQWREVQKLRLSCKQISDFFPALFENSSNFFPAPLFPLLRPSLLLEELIFKCRNALDSEVAALNERIPASHALRISTSFRLRRTIKAVVAKRKLGVNYHHLPNWDAPDDGRPVSANLLSVSAGSRYRVSKNIYPLVSLSTSVELSLDLWPESEQWAEKLLAHVATTAEYLKICLSRYAYVSDCMTKFPFLSRVPRLVIEIMPLTRGATTNGIRELVKAYLAGAREATASIVFGSHAAFFPLRDGFVENTVATKEAQEKRKNSCLNGDTFLFRNRTVSVSLECTESLSDRRYEFIVKAVLAGGQ